MNDYLTGDGRYRAARKTNQSNGRGWDLRPDIGAATERAERMGCIIRAALILAGGVLFIAVALMGAA